ncbi:MAG: hypothetical protein K0R48_809 [Gammaproteobacteria bacterium]|jgi:hypothetical protein|nr:hypothetical protein [Gammaproteobacteria bacterium]
MPGPFFRGLSHQRLKDRIAANELRLEKATALKQEITAFLNTRAIHLESATDIKYYFLEAAQQLNKSALAENGGLVRGYLTLIDFYGYNGEKANPDITPNMLYFCTYINSLDEEGLKAISPRFIKQFLEMIEELYDKRPEYEDRKTWVAKLLKEELAYEDQEKSRGNPNPEKAARAYYREREANIDTVKDAVTRLRASNLTTKEDNSFITLLSPSPFKR